MAYAYLKVHSKLPDNLFQGESANRDPWSSNISKIELVNSKVKE